MFNFREYIKKGFLNAVGKMSDYQIQGTGNKQSLLSVGEVLLYQAGIFNIWPGLIVSDFSPFNAFI